MPTQPNIFTLATASQISNASKLEIHTSEECPVSIPALSLWSSLAATPGTAGIEPDPVVEPKP